MIIAVEPICRGGEHAVMNAALLAAVRLAWPDDELLLVAEKEHIKVVQGRIKSEKISGIDYMAVQLPPKNRGVDSIPAEYGFCRKILGIAQEKSAKRVIFLAVNSHQLISLKQQLRKTSNKMTVMAIPHSILQTILRPRPRKPWNNLIWFRNALKWSIHDQLKVVVPGESLKQITLRELPQLENNLHALNLAYFFPDAKKIKHGIPEKLVSLGFLGVGSRRKGIDKFFELAAEIKKENLDDNAMKPQFSVVGPIEDEECRNNASLMDIPPPEIFLKPPEVAKLTRELHYAVFPYRAELYQLVASAAFLDAFAYLKPVIAMKNPYFEYYFEQMGDIGYLCDSLDDMKNVVKTLLSEWSEERYKAQCNNLLEGRKHFSPEVLAPQLRQIFASREDA